jgi:hypothetical protein
VEADKNFSSQLRLMNLSDGSPYETLHSIISNAVAPYFKSYLRATGKADRYVILSDLCYVLKLLNHSVNDVSCFAQNVFKCLLILLGQLSPYFEITALIT